MPAFERECMVAVFNRTDFGSEILGGDPLRDRLLKVACVAVWERTNAGSYDQSR
jgi:hypothetical protein